MEPERNQKETKGTRTLANWSQSEAKKGTNGNQTKPKGSRQETNGNHHETKRNPKDANGNQSETIRKPKGR